MNDWCSSSDPAYSITSASAAPHSAGIESRPKLRNAQHANAASTANSTKCTALKLNGLAPRAGSRLSIAAPLKLDHQKITPIHASKGVQ